MALSVLNTAVCVEYVFESVKILHLPLKFKHLPPREGRRQAKKKPTHKRGEVLAGRYG